MNVQEQLFADLIPGERRHAQEPMARHTTFRIGGPADLLLDAADAQEVQAVLTRCRARGIPVFVLGNGSNLLVADRGIRGVVLRIGEWMSGCHREGGRLVAGAGMRLSALARFAAREGLSGLAFAEGIPGSLGGGVAMNAGAYGGELAGVVAQVSVVDARGDTATLDREAMDFTYRDSALLRRGLYAHRVTLALQEGDPAEIHAEMAELSRRRREKQPLEKASAGSTFKRPAHEYASALIDQAGLRGYQVGPAQVSEKHAGFLINRGGATAAQVLSLMREVQQAVYTRFDVKLMPEVRLVGEFLPGEREGLEEIG